MGGTVLTLNRSDTQLITNTISGAGSVEIFGLHTVIFTGANTYGSTQIFESNTLQIGNGGTSGSLGTGAVINDGTLAFQHGGGQYTHANVISGSGNLVVRSASNVFEILTGNNNYTGTTTVESGILAVGQFGTTGTLGTGNVTISAGATLDLIRSDTQLIANAISGAGDLRVYGNHTAILTANNSYGNTTIFAGSTLQIGDGGSTGTLGTGAVINDGTLVFNHDVFSTTHNNAISGSGGLTINSTSTTNERLTGVNTYTGVTTINSGFLALAGAGSISNSSSITVNGTGRFDISNISGSSTSVRDIFLTTGTARISLSGKTLIVTEANSFAGQGRIFGSGLIDAVIFNVASTDFTLAGAQGAAFTNWTSGVDSITIIGNAGANTLTGDEVQATNIDGGAGNDRIVIGNGGGNYNGGADTDTLVVGSNMTLTGGLAGLEGIELLGATALTITSAQLASGLAFDATVTGGVASILTINMTAGVSLLTKAYNFTGFTGTVTVNGSSDVDVIKLGDALNIVNTNGGPNTVQGGNLVDDVVGGSDVDKIAGNGGADLLTGGLGADVFKYRRATDSGIGANADTITDFLSGTDRLNFVRIDANAGAAGDQAFTFVGTGAFTGGGQGSIRWVDLGSSLRVEADVNGDGVADMEVFLQGSGGQVLSAADFVL
jgi:fibronectin-binding autotransporter adhesin